MSEIQPIRLPLDEERVGAISYKILTAIRANYLRGPESRDRALEALNALAGAAAVVIMGCDGRGGEAEQFFRAALRQNLESMPPTIEPLT